MKLLVFAHKPPPHHGQSHMVKTVLDLFGGDARQQKSSDVAQPIQLYHIDARFSQGLEDIGRIRFGKFLLVFKYCMEAVWCRFRYGVRVFYYMPAPPQKGPIYRDWLVMALCRPFFSKFIYHWQAAGLGDWLRGEARGWQRWITRSLLGKPDLSIVLAEYNRRDADALQSRRTAVISNAITDPCPEFKNEILPRRLARSAALKERPAKRESINVLFLSLCYSEKGLFDTVEAISLANRKLQGTPFCMKLTVAGTFFYETEKGQFERRIEQPDLIEGGERMIEYIGFVAGERKKRLLMEADCFCFPSWYSAESFGLVLVEAMAFGLPIITTRWRAIPELLPKGYGGIVEPRSPEQIAAKLVQLPGQGYDARLREHFLKNFTIERFAEQFRAALGQL